MSPFMARCQNNGHPNGGGDMEGERKKTEGALTSTTEPKLRLSFSQWTTEAKRERESQATLVA